MKLVATLVIALAAAQLPAAVPPALLAGNERALSADRDLVPVYGPSEVTLFKGAERELAFWWDWRFGGSMFRSVGLFDGGYPSGEPFEPFRGFRPYGFIAIAQVGSGYLMIVDGNESGPSAPERGGFYALPLDSDGEPLLERPVRIWDSPGGETRIRLLSHGETALLLWSEAYSVRTLQLGAGGRLLEWSAPVEQLAGSVHRFDATVVGSSYLLLVGAWAGNGAEGLDGYAVPLTSEGDASGPLTPVMQRSEWWDLLVGGSDSAFALWYSGGWKGAVLSPEGRMLRETAYSSLGGGLGATRPALVRRPAGWTIATSSAEPPYEISLTDLDSNGSIVGTRTIAFPPDAPTGIDSPAENETPALVVSVWDGVEAASAIWFVDVAEAAPVRRSRISSMRALHAEGMEASKSDTLRFWSSMSGGSWATMHAALESRSEEIDLAPDDRRQLPVAASDGEKFLLLQRSEPSSVYGWTLAGRWLDRGGEVSAPFAVAAELFGAPVVAWSGSEFLAFWTRSATVKTTLTSGEMFVSSILSSGAAQTGSRFASGWNDPEDVLCGEAGCLVIWNDADLSQFCDFCEVPTRFLGARTLQSGERLSNPIELDDLGREARLAAAGSHIAVVELVPDTGLRVRVLDWNGAELARSSIADVASSPRFAAASFGDGAVVVWEAGGDLFGRVISSSGELGEVFPVANSGYEETRPFVATIGDTVQVMYDRVTPDAGWVPRVYVRKLSSAPARLRGVRR